MGKRHKNKQNNKNNSNCIHGTQVKTQKSNKSNFWIFAVIGLLVVGGVFIYYLTREPTKNSNSISNQAVPQTASANNPNIKMENGYQIIEMDVTSYGYSPNSFILKKGVPVKWRINGVKLTGCNNAIQVPKYNLEFKIKSGIQEIEFTPTETGRISWSCWMGMIRGSFTVVD